MNRRSGGAVLWYSLRPFLFYLIVFAVMSAALSAVSDYLLSGAPQAVQRYASDNAGMLFGIFYAAVYAAGLLVMLKPARNEIHYYEKIPSQAADADIRKQRTLYMILLAETLCLALFLNLLLGYTGMVQSDASMQASQNVESLMGLPLCVAVFGILAPLTEECVFRAVLCGRLERGFGRVCAVVVSSALFAVYHGNSPQMIYAFCMGLLFAVSYQLTHRFVIPYMLHACTNIVVLVLSFTGIFDKICTPVYILAFGALSGISILILCRMLFANKR